MKIRPHLAEEAEDARWNGGVDEVQDERAQRYVEERAEMVRDLYQEPSPWVVEGLRCARKLRRKMESQSGIA